MKHILTLAAASGFALATTCAIAETADERMQKAPTKSMGDQGKLPATDSMSGAVPQMTGPRTAATPADEAGSSASGPKGPAERMGDEGKLPATNNMSGNVPTMTPDDK